MLIPLLFVAGALFAIGAARPGVHVTTQSDIPAASGQVDAPSDDPAIAGDGGVQEPGDIASKAAVGAPSVLDELQIIAALVETRPAVDAPTPAPKPATEQGRRPANIFGPI